ncbi:MAG TPA: hypothetical protein VKU79_01875 [Thermoplasmataceae archaeon]|nr:hypothetical protein [Thermoplasmataceae archaeon]
MWLNRNLDRHRNITSSLLFGFIESYVGIFNFNLTLREITIIVVMSVVGIFASLVIYALLSDAEREVIHEVERNAKRGKAVKKIQHKDHSGQ